MEMLQLTQIIFSQWCLHKTKQLGMYICRNRRFIMLFTTQNSLLVNRLINDVTVSYAGKQQTIKALWDTGATGTCISTAVAQALAMVPTGKMNINTPAGSKVVNTYLLDITLPNMSE